jgi:hypothetical protein
MPCYLKGLIGLPKMVGGWFWWSWVQVGLLCGGEGGNPLRDVGLPPCQPTSEAAGGDAWSAPPRTHSQVVRPPPPAPWPPRTCCSMAARLAAGSGGSKATAEGSFRTPRGRVTTARCAAKTAPPAVATRTPAASWVMLVTTAGGARVVCRGVGVCACLGFVQVHLQGGQPSIARANPGRPSADDSSARNTHIILPHPRRGSVDPPSPQRPHSPVSSRTSSPPSRPAVSASIPPPTKTSSAGSVLASP